jgi:hypothetical protein
MNIPPAAASAITEAYKFLRGSVEDLLGDHSLLIDKSWDILGAWHESEPEGPLWGELAEPLAAKILLQSASLETLLTEQTTVHRHSNKHVKMRDMASIYTIARSQLEAYLTFFYLYIQPKTSDESELRYYLYVLHSLVLRQQVDVTTLPADLRLQHQNEAATIASYKAKIEANSVFMSYEKQNRNRLITGNRAKIIGWNGIIEASSLSNHIAKSYDIYTNHAHSEYLSLIQLRKQILSPEEAEFVFPVVVRTSIFILSVFIIELASFTNQQAFYESLSTEFKNKVTRWRQIITNMK